MVQVARLSSVLPDLSLVERLLVQPWLPVRWRRTWTTSGRSWSPSRSPPWPTVSPPVWVTPCVGPSVWQPTTVLSNIPSNTGTGSGLLYLVFSKSFYLLTDYILYPDRLYHLLLMEARIACMICNCLNKAELKFTAHHLIFI